MLMPKQIWRPVIGYEGLYEVSNTGRVRSLNFNHAGKRKVMKQATINQGYKRVNFNQGGKQKSFLVHRLVAQAFIPNPNAYPCINHKDENPSNNHVSNLEWCNRSYNNNYGTRNKRISKAHTGKTLGKETRKKISKSNKGKHGGRTRKVMCINNGMIFNTVTEACKWCGIKSCGEIAKQIQNKYKYIGKDPVTGERLQWRYID